jgi:hypothetical protein
MEYRFGFNGKELDEEVSGEGNYVDLGARGVNTRLGRLNWSIDPRSAEYPWQSPHAYFGNSPIAQLDYNGEGDYYGKDGKHLGNDNQKNDFVYTASGTKQVEILDENGKGTGNFNTEFLDANKLSITHAEFQKQAATIYGESSAYKTNNMTDELKYEMFAIASVLQRNNKAYGGSSVQAQLFLGTIVDGRNGTKMQLANAATINAITGGFDYSYGATQWDGQDQAMFPASNTNFRDYIGKRSVELHKNTMGWSISDAHYRKWKTNVGKGFNAPQTSYTPSEQGSFNKYFTPNAIKLKSTAVYGGTIFWKELKGSSIIKGT